MMFPCTSDTNGQSARLTNESGSLRPRRVRVCYFNTWADRREEAVAYAARVPGLSLAQRVSDPNDPVLLCKARLDCDWYGENTRCFSTLQHTAVEFLPSWVCGSAGLIELPQHIRETGEECWLITMGHQPQALNPGASKVFALLSRLGVKHLFYGFDEASRWMPCFGDIAPHLDVLIHDEAPLDAKNAARLKRGCQTIHRSWVANVVPFSVPFNEAQEEKIFFLGSQLGLTSHRLRQLDFLRKHFKDRFVAFHDHSIAVADRAALNRFKVSVCPEGRKFTTPAMATTHTDRPFWSGCLGLVPVSEDSTNGGRLQALHESKLIFRYEHANLKSLAEQCERALAMPNGERHRIYEHFNCHETVGTVVADAIAGAQCRR